MSKAQNITSLTQLKQRQQELSLEMEVSKQEFSDSLGNSKEHLSDFLLKKVALPVGGVIVGLYLLNRVMKHERAKQQPVMPMASQEQANQSVSHSATTAANTSRANARNFAPQEVTKKSFDFAKLLSFGKLAFPAVKAIMEVVADANRNQRR